MDTLSVRPLTANEREWIETLRIITLDRVPKPSLRAVQAVRLGLSNSQFMCPCDAGARCSKYP